MKYNRCSDAAVRSWFIGRIRGRRTSTVLSRVVVVDDGVKDSQLGLFFEGDRAEGFPESSSVEKCQLFGGGFANNVEQALRDGSGFLVVHSSVKTRTGACRHVAQLTETLAADRICGEDFL